MAMTYEEAYQKARTITPGLEMSHSNPTVWDSRVRSMADDILRQANRSDQSNSMSSKIGDAFSAWAGTSQDGTSQQPQYAAPTSSGNRFETGLASSESRLSGLLDDPSSIQQSAAYKFRLGQGQEALQRQQAAKGMLGSGNRLMELTQYGQDMASQEYDKQYGRLADLTGMYAGNWNQAQGANLQNAADVYGTQMQAHSAKGNTLSNLLASTYNTDANQYSASSNGVLNKSTGDFRWTS